MSDTQNQSSKTFPSKMMDAFEDALRNATTVQPGTPAYASSDYSHLIEAMIIAFMVWDAHKRWPTLDLRSRLSRWLPETLSELLLSRDQAFVTAFRQEFESRGNSQIKNSGDLKSHYLLLSRGIGQSGGRSPFLAKAESPTSNEGQVAAPHAASTASASVPAIRNLAVLARNSQWDELGQAIRGGGVDVNSRDDHMRTALHNAVVKGNAPIIRLLLDKGADVSARDNDGRTPLALALLFARDSTAHKEALGVFETFPREQHALKRSFIAKCSRCSERHSSLIEHQGQMHTCTACGHVFQLANDGGPLIEAGMTRGAVVRILGDPAETITGARALVDDTNGFPLSRYPEAGASEKAAFVHEGTCHIVLFKWGVVAEVSSRILDSGHTDRSSPRGSPPDSLSVPLECDCPYCGKPVQLPPDAGGRFECQCLKCQGRFDVEIE